MVRKIVCVFSIPTEYRIRLNGSENSLRVFDPDCFSVFFPILIFLIIRYTIGIYEIRCRLIGNIRVLAFIPTMPPHRPHSVGASTATVPPPTPDRSLTALASSAGTGMPNLGSNNTNTHYNVKNQLYLGRGCLNRQWARNKHCRRFNGEATHLVMFG